jgi:hypothetical protein
MTEKEVCGQVDDEISGVVASNTFSYAMTLFAQSLSGVRGIEVSEAGRTDNVHVLVLSVPIWSWLRTPHCHKPRHSTWNAQIPLLSLL